MSYQSPPDVMKGILQIDEMQIATKEVVEVACDNLIVGQAREDMQKSCNNMPFLRQDSILQEGRRVN